MAGHDTGNGQRGSQITTVIATARATTIRSREDILIVPLGQIVIAVRIDMTLKMRGDAAVVLQPEIRLEMTGMSAPVEITGHPTTMLGIMLTALVEIRIIVTGSRFS